MTILAATAYGEYPTGLSTPFAVVLWIAAVVSAATGAIALGLPRGAATQPRPTTLAIAALAAGVASAAVFVVTIVAQLSMNSSPTIPTVGPWASLVIGGLSFVLGILGLVTAHRDGPSRRMSSAAVVLGLGPAITAILVSSRYCYLIVDHARGCFGP